MRKTFVRFFTIADYEEEEAWLRSQHQNGWKLVKMVPPCFYVFEACEAQDMIYRLDFKNDKRTDEYMQMLRDFGWEYLGECFGWLYFRKPASDAETEADGELLSDDESRLDHITTIVKTRLWPLVVIFLCCVLPNLFRYTLGGHAGGLEAFFAIFFGVMFVVYAFLITYTGIKLKRKRDRYKKD